jgi:hypothetical protein
MAAHDDNGVDGGAVILGAEKFRDRKQLAVLAAARSYVDRDGFHGKLLCTMADQESRETMEKSGDYKFARA